MDCPEGTVNNSFVSCLALISEFFMVSFFAHSGLIEVVAYKFFTITVSPFFFFSFSQSGNADEHEEDFTGHFYNGTC